MTRNRSIILLLVLACFIVPMGWMVFGEGGGCAGFRLSGTESEEEREKTEAEKRKEEEEGKEKEKPPFESLQATILPGMVSNDDESDEVIAEEDLDEDIMTGSEPRAPRRVAAKPGHWVHVRYETKANNFDFNGRLTVACIDKELNPIDLENSPFHSSTTRPIVLPKGQYKNAELPLFVTVPTNTTNRTVQMHARLRRRGGRDEAQDYTPILRLKPHQYHMVVMSSDPDRYGYVRSLDSVKPPLGDWVIDAVKEDYIVTLHGEGENESMLVPGNPLAWTSIAYLIWDDIRPDALAPDQQSAMLDWLHFGGQLIISGPQSLDPLRASFLGEYLPATSDRSEVATTKMLAPINNVWSLDPKETELDRSMYRLLSTEERPLELTPLEPTEGSAVVPTTGGLVVERKVGRGRIVVTAFSLGDRNVVNWQNFDGFFNGCLLRRPGRRYKMTNAGFPQVDFSRMSLKRQDARINTGLRYFSRDVAIPGEGRDGQAAPLSAEAGATGGAVQESLSPSQLQKKWGLDWKSTTSADRRRAVAGFRSDTDAGIGGWSDFSATSVAARRSLQVAAGIKVPKAGFVAKVLAGYLICLVPINWLLFRVLRRVEWAWFAAPLIAIGGAIGVIRLAQLDIGFVRSRTEIAVLETQPGYARGHLTRYCGMYTSLTSDYAMEFEDSNAVGLPFSTNPTREQLRLQKQKGKAVPFVRDTIVSLSGYPVLSNSTGMVHVEQMVDLPGQVEFIRVDDGGAPKIRNGLDCQINSAVAVHVEKDGVWMVPLGDLEAGAEVTVPDGKPGDLQPLMQQLAKNSATASTVAQGEVSLRELIRLAVHPSTTRPGGWRLVGWTDQAIEGMTISPAANQNLYRTLLVCHLDHGVLPEPAVDKNHAADYQPEPDEEFDLGLGTE